MASDPHVERAERRLLAERQRNQEKALATAAAAQVMKIERERQYAKDHPSDDPIAKFSRVWRDDHPETAQTRAQTRAQKCATEVTMRQEASNRNGSGPAEGGQKDESDSSLE